MRRLSIPNITVPSRITLPLKYIGKIQTEIEIVDFESPIGNLHQEFSSSSFDAHHHEHICGMDGMLLMEVCTELGNRYDAARFFCEHCLRVNLNLGNG